MIKQYNATRKTLKWTRKVVVHLIQISMLNAFILYGKSGGEKTFLKFQHDASSWII